jgi:hypothetical protein
MGELRSISGPHATKVGEALELMMKKHKAGRLPALLFIAEEIGNPHPIYGIVGRFRDDPAKAIGHLAIMEKKVRDFAAELAPDIEDPR